MAETILEKLELIEVTKEDNGQKAVLTFLDRENGEIREVNFNKRVYDANAKGQDRWVENEEKAAKVEEWCKEYFDTDFVGLESKVGVKMDVYVYDGFNSLFPVKQIKKFDADMEGQIINSKIETVEDDGNAVRIGFEYEGELYESKMSYSKYHETMKQWFVDPQKRAKVYKKFEEKYGVPVDRMGDLVGKTIMVEVKVAFGEFPYAEIKPFAKKKKK